MTSVRLIDADQIRSNLPWSELISALEAIVRSDNAVSPDRHVHELELADGSTGALLIMPSWIPDDVMGVKTVTYFPTNVGTPIPTINAAYLLFDGRDGRLIAVLDGDELTARRTAAVSALAASHLSRPDARRLLVVGTGQLSSNMAQAYDAIRQLDSIEIWGRNEAAAARVAGELIELGLRAQPSRDLAASVREADIISCVTGATDPLIHGVDLTPGTHLDLVGGFRSDMRESDDDAIMRSSLFVDTVAGAIQSGDLAQPIAAGVITEASILGDLRALASGRHPGRTSDGEITLFKSAGFASADLAAARLAWSRLQEP